VNRTHVGRAGTVALALGLLLAGPAAVFAANTVTEDVTAGTRTASITDLALQSLPVAHVDTTTAGDSLDLGVDDSSGTGAGWNVTIESSDLVYSGANNGTDIPADHLAIGTPLAPAHTAGQAIDGTNGPLLVGAGGTLDAPVKVINAAADYGQGTYTQSIPVALTVPAESRVGTYTATLTVSITAGP
jgi:hypothetical protein